MVSISATVLVRLDTLPFPFLSFCSSLLLTIKLATHLKNPAKAFSRSENRLP
jgi:hypothetical protein